MKNNYETYEDLKEAALKTGYISVIRVSSNLTSLFDGDSQINYIFTNGYWHRSA